jgi:hypothetical protein
LSLLFRIVQLDLFLILIPFGYQLFLSNHIFNNAIFTKDMSALATERFYYLVKTERALVEFLLGVLSKALLDSTPVLQHLFLCIGEDGMGGVIL